MHFKNLFEKGKNGAGLYHSTMQVFLLFHSPQAKQLPDVNWGFFRWACGFGFSNQRGESDYHINLSHFLSYVLEVVKKNK